MLGDNLFTVRSVAGLALAIAAIALVTSLPFFARLRRPRLFALAVGLLSFQVFHLVEHLIQLSYWFLHPNAMPYMTPWAQEGADGLGLWATLMPGEGNMMQRGMELLHLVGNLLFLGGIVALEKLATRPLRGLRLAKAIQSVHVLEHVLLTASVFAIGSPIGISTVFGLGEATAWGPTVRVWFHFLINLAATVPAVLALRAHNANKKTAQELSEDSAGPQPALVAR